MTMNRKKMAVIAAIAVCTALCGCSTVAKEKPLYLYAVGVDGDENGVRLSFLCCEGTSGGDSESDGSDSRKTGHPLSLRRFGGKTVREAFGRFEEENTERYVGTTALYVLSENLSSKTERDFAEWLLNAPDWPLKAGLVRSDDADGHLASLRDAYSDADVTDSLEGRYENAVTALVKMTGEGLYGKTAE